MVDAVRKRTRNITPEDFYLRFSLHVVEKNVLDDAGDPMDTKSNSVLQQDNKEKYVLNFKHSLKIFAWERPRCLSVTTQVTRSYLLERKKWKQHPGGCAFINK